MLTGIFSVLKVNLIKSGRSEKEETDKRTKTEVCTTKQQAIESENGKFVCTLHPHVLMFSLIHLTSIWD